VPGGGTSFDQRSGNWRKVAEARDVTHIDFKGVRTPGNFGRGNREKSAMPIEADAEASLPLDH